MGQRWTEADVALAVARMAGRMRTESGGLLPPDVPEEALLTRVRRLARESGWQFHHVRDSRGCDPGFPDVCCAKPGRLLFAELKRRGGKLTAEQHTWLDVLRHTVPGVEVYHWEPADWPAIVQILTHAPAS